MTVHNACLNILRNEQRRQLNERSLDPEHVEHEKELFAAEIEINLYARMLAAIGQLPAQQKNILQLCYLQGKDNAEAAAILGISVQTLKNQKVTALKALRSRFGKQDLLFFGCLISFNAFVNG